jgi:hypothetical protein
LYWAQHWEYFSWHYVLEGGMEMINWLLTATSDGATRLQALILIMGAIGALMMILQTASEVSDIIKAHGGNREQA